MQIGKCRVSIFRNALIKDGQRIDMPKVVLDIRYKDEQTGRRKSIKHDIARNSKAVLTLIKAFDYLPTKAQPAKISQKQTFIKFPVFIEMYSIN